MKALERLIRGKAAVSMAIMLMRLGTLGAKFALTLFVARFMDLESLGLYGLIAGATIVGPVVMNFGLLNTLSREAVGLPEREVALVMRHYWAVVVAAYALLGMALTALSAWMPLPVLWPWVLGITLLEHVNQDVFVVLVNRHQALLANVLMFLRAGVWILAFMVLAFLFPGGRDIPTLLVFWLAGLVVPMLVFAILAREWGWRDALFSRWPPGWLRGKVASARLLYVADLANVAGQYADRYLISLFLGLEMTGVYVFFWQIGNALYGLVNAGVMQAYRPRLVEAFRQGNDIAFWSAFRSCTRETLVVLIPFVLLVALVFPWGLPLFKPSLASHMFLGWLILVTVCVKSLCDITGYPLFTRGLDAAFSGGYVLVLVLNIAMGLLLMPWLGVYGYAGAVMLANGLVFAQRAWHIRNLTQRRTHHV